jgi:hypothetical protein
MYANRIPEDVAAAINESWPSGTIEEFDTDESYFHDIHAALERDLRKLSRASLLWQTKARDYSSNWDREEDDWEHDEPPPSRDFQSYHVFFLAPLGNEFEFETETENFEEPEEPEDPNSDVVTVTVPGNGRYGCSVSVSYASPFAAVSFCEYAQFEDGSDSPPDPSNFTYFDEETGAPVDPAVHYRDTLGEGAFAKLENLWAGIAKVMAKHGVVVLDQAILDLPAPDLRADGDVFMSETPSVRDAFFFRGV